MSFDRIEIHPVTESITIWNLVVRDRSLKPQLRAGRVEVEVDALNLQRSAFALHLSRLEVHDFDLALIWDEFGRLRLMEGFSSRIIDTVDKPPPPKTFSLSLTDIILREGTLELAWERNNFGFRFHRVQGTGSVEIAEGEVAIDVQKLEAQESAVWFDAKDTDWNERLKAIPSHAVSQMSNTGDAVLSLDAVSFDDFKWAGRAFNTKLLVDISGPSKVRAAGGMEFSKGVPPTYSLALDVDISNDVVTSISRDAVHGHVLTSIQLTGAGSDLKMKLAELHLDSVDTGEAKLFRTQLRNIELDGRDSTVDAKVDIGAQRLTWRGGALEDCFVLATAQISWPGLSVSHLLSSPRKRPPLAGLLRAKANLSIARASAKSVVLGPERYTSFRLDGLEVDASMPKFNARLQHTSAAGLGSVSSHIDGQIQVGFGNISAPAQIKVVTHEVPSSIFERLNLQLPQVIPETRFTGHIELTADAMDLNTITVKSIEVQ
ncbi:MAG: hypothetical protein VX223_09415 [Myxococcota bacterium]|nr:hypothetical protein [Myxococcota bacterium]